MITFTQKELPRNIQPSYLAPSLSVKNVAVDFDPANADHRHAYVNFIKTKKWTMRFNTKWPLSVEASCQAALAKLACENEWY